MLDSILLVQDCLLTSARRRACQERLEPVMVPKYLRIIDELPRTTTGKIQKRGLA
jgi:acyl-coenzyme A synthetase/AMP-(fatty) acid ligase